MTSPANTSSPADRQPNRIWLWVLSLFLAGLGAKLWLIHRFGSSLPIWDGWEEAPYAYMPFFHGRLSWHDLFAPHNEHRIFFTRIYGLVLLLLNGQWDAQLQMAGSAILDALVIVSLGKLLARKIGTDCWPWLWLPLAAVLVLPFAWENTLSGFQSQFYFLLLFSLPVLWLLVRCPAWSWRWWLGVVCGVCALFTVAAGFIAATAVFAMLILKIIRRRDGWQAYVPTLAVCVALTMAGLALTVPVPQHAVLKAQSARDFLVSFGSNLAWPWIVVPPFAVVNCLPLLLLGWFYLRSREENLQAEELVLVLGGWTIISAAASGYARGAGGAFPQWRYMDGASFVLIANAAALLLLMKRYHGCLPPGRWKVPAATLWGLVNMAGLLLLSGRAWSFDIPERTFYSRAHIKSARAFLATDDIRFLSAKLKPERALIFPNRLAWILRDPNIRSRLPAGVRDPLLVLPANPTNNTFVPRGWNLPKPDAPTELSWGSWNAQGAAATGEFESQPIRASKFPYLEIEVAGDLGKPRLSLELVGVTSHERIPVEPRRVPGDHWEKCDVKAPAGPFVIVAKDNDPNGWFAFREPREIARLSFWNTRLLSAGAVLFWMGVAIYTLAWVLRLRAPRGERCLNPSAPCPSDSPRG